VAIDTAVKFLKMRRTKIVATLGPASSELTMIERLVAAGVNVFRLNMSHGDYDQHHANFQRVRQVASKMRAHVAVLADLSGPKIRVGRFPEGPIVLEDGSEVVVTTRDVPGRPGLIPSQYQTLAKDVRSGDRILLADGSMELKVESAQNTEIRCRVIEGGKLSDNKGINLPGVNVSAPALTEKDRQDAHAALEMGVDFLALSFVRCAADVSELKSLIDTANHQTAVIAKIERPEALAEIDSILDVTDAIMVARGDLGVELPPEQVPVVQRQLIDKGRAKDKPVIVATQMLESMITSARATRAEVADVSLAVSSGADAIMLSGETAMGAYPPQAVGMMDRIARQAEAYLWGHGAFGTFPQAHNTPPISTSDAVGNATALLSRDLLVRMILVVSPSGVSAAAVSAARPSAPVVAVSANAETCRRMALLWGVTPFHISVDETDDPVLLASRLAQQLKLANPGEHILLVRGFHTDIRKNVPSVTVLTV